MALNLQHYSSKIHKRFYTNFVKLDFVRFISFESLLLFFLTNIKPNSRFFLNCGCHFGERAKYKLCILKYFAKFGQNIPKIYLYKRSIYSATTADRKIMHITFK